MDLRSLYSENLCLSGGAEGADLQWGMCAGSLGHNVIHWSFQGHTTYAPDCEVVRLDDEQLKAADPFLQIAKVDLQRNLPKNSYILNLLRRNHYQVAWSDSLYAVGQLMDTGKPSGGTAWAVQMFLNRATVLPCYFYDQPTENWFQWDYQEKQWDFADPVQPKGLWAGVGTRDLLPCGKNAIRKLMGYSTAN
jgi:hypothetical protein